MNANEIKEFDCPVCSLKRWLIEVLGLKETAPKANQRLHDEAASALIGRSLIPLGNTLSMNSYEGVPLPKEVVERLLIGAELPGLGYVTDICTECGAIYAKKVRRFVGKKGITTAKMAPPKIDLSKITNDPRFS
ncbi:hypothetical protein LCGC14_0985120 [marine sediment metagenome]|uniref:Uncharacterized protein n=1 Tax=marine sediment metagenome TaxID=412755 RepID=A0A0F9QQR4_9ZZZZ